MLKLTKIHVLSLLNSLEDCEEEGSTQKLPPMLDALVQRNLIKRILEHASKLLNVTVHDKTNHIAQKKTFELRPPLPNTAFKLPLVKIWSL